MMIFAGSLQPGQWWWWWSSSSSPSSPSSSSSSPSSSSSLPVVSGRDASEACDGLRWVWTLWHWKTEGLDFWEERSIWIELCSHPPKNIQIFSHKKMDDETRDILDFHQIDFACQDLADTSFYWEWRDGALRGPFDPSKVFQDPCRDVTPLKSCNPTTSKSPEKIPSLCVAKLSCFCRFLPISSCERFWDWCTWVVVFI